MKTVMLGYMLGSSLIVAGDIMPWDNPMLIQCSAIGILGWTLWYLLAKVIPLHLRTIRDEREALMQAQRREQKSMQKSLRQLAHALRMLSKDRHH